MNTDHFVNHDRVMKDNGIACVSKPARYHTHMQLLIVLQASLSGDFSSETSSSIDAVISQHAGQ